MSIAFGRLCVEPIKYCPRSVYLERKQRGVLVQLGKLTVACRRAPLLDLSSTYPKPHSYKKKRSTETHTKQPNHHKSQVQPNAFFPCHSIQSKFCITRCAFRIPIPDSLAGITSKIKYEKKEARPPNRDTQWSISPFCPALILFRYSISQIKLWGPIESTSTFNRIHSIRNWCASIKAHWLYIKAQ